MTETAAQQVEPTSPFRKAGASEERVKIFGWGDAGAGKTTLALQFPKPVVIDFERGTSLYGTTFDFDVLHVTTAEEVVGALDWLKTQPHEYRTLVLDPITLWWDAVQRRWNDVFLKRAKAAKGFKFEYFELGPKEWAVIKADWKDLLRKVLSLDMNVIATARQKTQYVDGAFMQAAGVTFDGERTLPHVFDIVLHLSRDKGGRFMAEASKDRSNRLPKGEFEISYAVLAKAFGEDALARAARPVVAATDDQRAQLRELINTLKIPQDQVTKRCAAHGAEGLHDLSSDAATAIIEKWTAALAARQNANPSPKGD
jgi:hypothetical protein